MLEARDRPRDVGTEGVVVDAESMWRKSRHPTQQEGVALDEFTDCAGCSIVKVFTCC